jgi:hypothetical protein
MEEALQLELLVAWTKSLKSWWTREKPKHVEEGKEENM